MAEKVGTPTPANSRKDQKSVPLPQAYFLLQASRIASHHVIILVADSSDASCFTSVHAALIAAGAFTTVIGLKQQAMFAAVGGDKSGKGLVTDHQFEGARSKLFDSIHLPAGQYVETLRKSSRVLRWVREVLGHLKAIGAVDKAVALAKDGCGVRRDAVCRLR